MLYYLAVQSYLLHQYEEALSYLTEAESNHELVGLSCSINFYLTLRKMSRFFL